MTQRGAYYNEIDQHKALWLKELMKRELIAEGDIDTRSIELVQPADVAGYERVHWFAGIGIWDYALAGWIGPVWTASCPCQPFSAAGKRKGTEDSRHLWPVLARLIRVGRPPTIFGEQVSSVDGLAWFSDVRTDLEAAEYRAWALDTCAAGVGAPHIRQRLYWAARLADVQHGGREGWDTQRAGASAALPRVEAGRLEHDTRDGWQPRRPEPGGGGTERGCGAVRLGDVPSAGPLPGAHGRVHRGEDGRGARDGQPQRPGDADGVGYSELSEWRAGERQHGGHRQEEGRQQSADWAGKPGPVNGYWRGADWVLTRPQRVGDAPSLRPVESTFGALDDGAAPGVVRGGYSRFPLSQGEEARVLRLKGYGDGIVSQQAAAFVQACAEEWGL